MHFAVSKIRYYIEFIFSIGKRHSLRTCMWLVLRVNRARSLSVYCNVRQSQLIEKI